MTTYKKILITGIVSEFLYLCLLFIDPLRRYWGDNSLTLTSNNLYFLICGILLTLFYFYFKTSCFQFDPKSFRLALIFFGIFSLTNLFSYPLTSIDIFTYMHTSRVLSVHHQNPYIHNFNEYPTDTLAPQIKNCWSDKPTPYAPLFTILSSILSFLGQSNLYLSLYLFKIFFIALNILSLFLVYKITHDYKISFLYAWNPLLLFEFGINGHNDIVSIFLLLTALFFAQRKNLNNYLLAIIFIMLSALIKYVTAILLPIAFIFFFKNLEKKSEKIKFFIWSIIVSLLITVAFYLPFWTGTEIFSRLFSQASNFSKTWIFSSPLIIILAAILDLFKVKMLIPLSTQISKIIFYLSYPLLLAYLFSRKNLKSEKLWSWLAISLGLFYATFFTWLMPWYLGVLLSLLVLSSKFEKKYFYLSHALTIYALLYYIILR